MKTNESAADSSLHRQTSGRFAVTPACASWRFSPGSPILHRLLFVWLVVVAVTKEAGAGSALGLSITPPPRRDVITGSLTYAIHVTNQSAFPAENVRVTVELPPSMQFLRATNHYSVAPSISVGESNVVFLYPQVNAGDVARMRVSVLPMVVGPVTKTVSVSASGMPDPISARCGFTVRSIQVSIHDPAMAKEGDTYYLFSSGPGITFYSSKDMVHWRLRGRVFPGEPAWARNVNPAFNGHVWAPDIIRHNGTYHLYYAVSSPGSIRSAIGLITNKTLDPDSPDYGWQDEGIVLQSVPGRDLWNAIDPNVVVDNEGTAWMAFGSFWSGLKLVKLDSKWRAPAHPQEWRSIAKRERSVLVDDLEPGPAEIEGPFIFKKGDYYYLFVSWGLCCRGADSTYRIMVGRSKNVKGPYLDKEGNSMARGGGTLLLGGNPAWPALGHNSAYTFDGKDYLVFHAYEAADNGLQKLKIAEIKWDENQWPVIDEKELFEYESVVVK